MLSRFKFRIMALALVLCCFLSLPVGAAAAYGKGDDFTYSGDFSSDSLEQIIEQYLTDSNIKSEKFSMGFYDTVTGEEYYYNGDVYMEAGSMFKLPMNMIFAEMVYNGELGWEDIVGNHQLLAGMEQSLVYSNNGVSYSMLTALGKKTQQQRENLARFSEEELDQVFYKKNFFTPKYMISVLKTLYANEGGRYDRVLEFMEQANPTLYFRYYDQPYTVAHKYGSWDGNLNDSGIIYGPHPILLVVFTKGVTHNMDTLAQVCRIAADYSTYLGQEDQRTAEAEAQPEDTAPPAAEVAETAPPAAAVTESPVQAASQSAEEVSSVSEKDHTAAAYALIALCGICFVLLVCILLYFKRRRGGRTPR